MAATDDSPANVHYQRTFNCPSGLEVPASDDSDISATIRRRPVDLVIEGWTGTLWAELDDLPIAGPLPSAAAPLRIAVTERLRGHHRLGIRLAPSDDSPPRLTGIVALEIHDSP